MRVITLHQPYASLIAIEAKTIETRSWSVDYRGPPFGMRRRRSWNGGMRHSGRTGEDETGSRPCLKVAH